MSDKQFVFIPYQDSDNFYSDGILTREFSMLYIFWKKGYKDVINIKKPRTFLDKKRYVINGKFYPDGTVENKVKEILDTSETLQYLPIFSIRQIQKKREWWEKGYLEILDSLKEKIRNPNNCIVYSDNPFAVLILKELKKYGCKIYFDIMDNFAIHPSLSSGERIEALDAYRKILEFADCISANSQQTCDYMKKYVFGKNILLIKNGVFLKNEVKGTSTLAQIQEVIKKKKKYKRTVGYIGKIGKRLDDQLIDYISKKSKDTLFVFVGPLLKGQMNDSLINIFKSRNNVLHLNGIPSAYVYSMLNVFDILMIPHSVGENENGGDPLKLYQYLTRNKPIITTRILGVDEFENIIKISNNYDEWIKFIHSKHFKEINQNKGCYDWETRIKPVMRIMNI